MTGALPADQVRKLDAVVKEAMPKAATPGVIVAVQTPNGTWKKAYGEADPVKGTPMKIGQHTRIGSVTKTFTGTLIMQLAEQGKLSLDDTIDQYVPGVPNGDRVTLRQLTDMSSGIPSYTRSEEFTGPYFSKPQTIFKPEKLLQIGLKQQPLFEPGEGFDYSNTNTVLLGFVAEKVTGEKVEDVFQQLVFGPLKLTNTSFPGESTAMPEPFAQGYTLQGDFDTPDNPTNATHWNPAWGWTAGEMISNVDDLLVYGRALGTGVGLLNPKSQQERLESFPAPAGYGIGAGCVDGWIGHDGTLPGYNTSVYYSTDLDTTVIIQVNSDIPSGDCSDSDVLVDNPGNLECQLPASRILVAVTTELGKPFTPIPQH